MEPPYLLPMLCAPPQWDSSPVGWLLHSLHVQEYIAQIPFHLPAPSPSDQGTLQSWLLACVFKGFYLKWAPFILENPYPPLGLSNHTT
jgi:hypothetical protein